MRLFKDTVAVLVVAAGLIGCSNGARDVIEASGIIEGTTINIGTEAGGRVKEIRVEEGSPVMKGDTLLIIDDVEYQIQLRQSLANVEAFESVYRLSVEGSRAEDILQAETTFKTAETDYGRMKDLLASQTITQKQYDDSYARFVATQQTYEKLRRGSRPEEINGARVRRDYAAAQADLLRKKVRDCTLLAPANGTVTLKSVEPGELVSVGFNVLRLTYLDKVKLTIYVNETELGRVTLGQEAQITVDTYGTGRTFRGKVVSISPSAEFTPKNVQTKEERTKLVFGVKIEVENPDHALKPGLPADARINLAQR
jgi:HlyD family secretion protein